MSTEQHGDIKKTRVRVPETSSEGGKIIKRHVPISFSNLIIFFIIFGVLAAAQIALNTHENQTTSINISPPVITAEEEIIFADSEDIQNEAEVAEPEATPVFNDDQERTGNVQTAETLKSSQEEGKTKIADSEAQPENPSSGNNEEIIEEVSIKTDNKSAAETFVEQTDMPVKSEIISKRSRRINPYYEKDPYTNGSDLDLDGPQYRKEYRDSNIVLVPVEESDKKAVARRTSN